MRPARVRAVAVTRPEQSSLHVELRTEWLNGSACVVGVGGDLDLATAPELRDELLRVVGEGCSELVVDLSEVTFIDSTALGVLSESSKRLRRLGGHMAVACPDVNLTKIFLITGLDRLFHVSKTLSGALEAAGLGPAPAA